MDGDTLYSIGDLARRTGLTVKTVRFYSDEGIVPPADRSPSGYRLYGTDAVARLDLVRTLRELGVDLATIRKVVDREISLPEVAAAHADALMCRSACCACGARCSRRWPSAAPPQRSWTSCTSWPSSPRPNVDVWSTTSSAPSSTDCATTPPSRRSSAR